MKECTYGATPWTLLNRPVGLPALHGRDGEDDGAKPEAGSEKNDESKDGAKPDGDNEDEGKDKGKEPKPETVESLTRQLANAKEASSRAADKRDEYKAEVGKLTAQIAKMEKDGSPDATIKQENESLKAQVATATATNEQLRLELALRDDTAHVWVDSTKVLKLVDLSEVDFDAKTGQPRGLKAALDKLAKDSPYLLKPKDDANDDESNGKPAPRGTGRPPAPKGTTRDAKAVAQEQALKAKYPALRRG